jgi:hypothetical protein
MVSIRRFLVLSWAVLYVTTWCFAAEAPSVEGVQSEAVKWIKKNNAFGPDAPIVRDMSAAIAEHMEEGQNVHLYFGKGLMKSKTYQTLHVWGRYTFSFTLKDAQANTMELGEQGVQLQTGKQQGTPAESLAFELSDLTIEQADDLDPTVKFKGTVHCVATGEVPEGEYAIRVGYQAANNVNQFQYLTVTPESAGTDLEFSFGPITGDDDKPHHGPTPLFFDIATVKESNGEVQITSYSNAVAAMANVR